jgi:hypothetical protein
MYCSSLNWASWLASAKTVASSLRPFFLDDLRRLIGVN